MSNNKINHILSDVPVFVLVVKCGSFTAAARQMGMTPSALSRQVKRLEHTLGTTLLDRNTRRSRLTEIGSQIYELSESMVLAGNDILQVAENAREIPSGTVRVSAPKALGKQIIHPLVPEFLDRFPQVNVQLVITDQKMDIINDKLDLLIHITNQPIEGLVARALGKVNQVLVASPDYLQKHGAPEHPRNLNVHQCLFLGETQFDSSWEFHSGDEICQVTVKGRYSVNHTEARLDAVKRNMGIACIPDFVVNEALKLGEVIKVLPDWNFSGPYGGSIFVQYPYSKHMPPKTRVFSDFLCEVLDAQDEG
jgi:DNA-binding transcriptional LysR family regulator